MVKVSRFLEQHQEPQSRNQIEQAVGGKAQYVRIAIDALIAEGFATEFSGARGARLVRLERAFRETEEAGVTDRPSRSYKLGRRGRHKGASSPETRRWTEISAGTAWLSGDAGNGDVDGHPDPSQAVTEAPTASIPVAPPPPCPPWLDEAAYAALLDLRKGLS